MKEKLVKLYNLLSWYMLYGNGQEIKSTNKIDELIKEIKEIRDGQ